MKKSSKTLLLLGAAGLAAVYFLRGKGGVSGIFGTRTTPFSAPRAVQTASDPATDGLPGIPLFGTTLGEFVGGNNFLNSAYMQYSGLNFDNGVTSAPMLGNFTASKPIFSGTNLSGAVTIDNGPKFDPFKSGVKIGGDFVIDNGQPSGSFFNIFQ